MFESSPFGEASGRPAPVAVETFHALKQRQQSEGIATGRDMTGRVNLLNWDGVGTPEALFPGRGEDSVVSTNEQLQQRRVVHRAASSMLCYPDADVLQQLPAIEAALLTFPAGIAPRASLIRLLQHLSGGIPMISSGITSTSSTSHQSAASTCRTTPMATPADGDPSSPSSRRGTARAASSSTRGELPDYLPLVLEYAAVADPTDGMRMLQDYRPSIELLRLALLDLDTPYAAPDAVCATLPVRPLPTPPRSCGWRRRVRPAKESGWSRWHSEPADERPRHCPVGCVAVHRDRAARRRHNLAISL